MEVIIIFLLILLNAIFALAEIAIVSSKKFRLQKLANEGNKDAQIALSLANNPSEFLSTVQFGITLISIVAGAFGETSLAGPVNEQLAKIPFLAPVSRPLSFIIVVGLITYLTLVIGEIVPKRLALLNSEKLALVVARPMNFLSQIAAPIVGLLSVSTNFVLSFFKFRQSHETQITDEEVNLLIREGAKTGVFELEEKDIVERTLKLSDKRVIELMSPRSEIDWIDVDATFRTVRNKIAKKGHSHYPVCRDSLDKVVGIVQTQELLKHFLLEEQVKLKQILHKPLYVPESMQAFKLLEMFRKSGIHLALVLDEYGSVQGAISLTDILEEIVGDIPSINELEDEDIIKRDDLSWLVSGLVTIDEFKDYFQIRKLPGERSGVYHTFGGFVMHMLGKIPVTGDKISWDGFQFEIVDMDDNRIDKVLVTRINK